MVVTIFWLCWWWTALSSFSHGLTYNFPLGYHMAQFLAHMMELSRRPNALTVVAKIVTGRVWSTGPFINPVTIEIRRGPVNVLTFTSIISRSFSMSYVDGGEGAVTAAVMQAIDQSQLGGGGVFKGVVDGPFLLTVEPGPYGRSKRRRVSSAMNFAYGNGELASNFNSFQDPITYNEVPLHEALYIDTDLNNNRGIKQLYKFDGSIKRLLEGPVGARKSPMTRKSFTRENVKRLNLTLVPLAKRRRRT